jgi:hypothetical protein
MSVAAQGRTRVRADIPRRHTDKTGSNAMTTYLPIRDNAAIRESVQNMSTERPAGQAV